MQEMTADLIKLADTFEKAGKEGKKAQRGAHQELSGVMLSGLRGEVAGRVNDSHGRIAGFQQKYVGSGGYAAVRASDRGTGANSPGAITNYLENGHAIRRPSGASGYRPRIRTLYVGGRAFYAAARGQLAGMLHRAAEQMASTVAGAIEGG